MSDTEVVQLPGPRCTTSGCIGQVYSAPAAPAGACAALDAGAWPPPCACAGPP